MTIDDRITEALRRITEGLGAMRIPADPCDADLVLSDAKSELGALRAQLEAVTRERDGLKAMGEKVNAIRNSIVGMQGFNFSEHAYPLVAALDEAGFEGLPYPEARANVGTLLDRIAALERERNEARAEAARLREALMQVRDAMLATGQGPDGDDDPRRPVATVVWRALASTPSAEPTPRDMRVAEAVANALMDAAWRGVVDIRAIVAKVTP